jgi:catechol 2,3-dioxygenase-like lactoylglutathione lyase family enzyme
MAIEINGMAHVILTVSRFEVAREFYRRLLPEFGMKVVFDGDRFFYCVGADCDRHPTMRSGAGWRALHPAAGRPAPSLPASPLARGRGQMCRSAQRGGRDHRSRPRRRHMGAGLLLRVVRGPGRHQAGGKLCSGRRPARGGGAVSPRPTQYGLRLRRPIGTPSRHPPARADGGGDAKQVFGITRKERDQPKSKALHLDRRSRRHH